MKNYLQFGFIELNFLLRKFPAPMQSELIKALFNEYKRLLEDIHYQLPDNHLFCRQAKDLEKMERDIIRNPQVVTKQLQEQLEEAITEIGVLPV